jgi:hypothetical protein
MQDEPLIRVVSGTPTAEELAAFVGVLLSRRSAPDEPAPAASRWAHSARPQPALRTGPSAWAASRLPRY